MSNHSLHFNEKQRRWIATYRAIGGDWKHKWLPKTFATTARIEAEQWFATWYGDFLRNGMGSKNEDVRPRRTLAMLGPAWLDIRARQVGTKPNYLKMIRSAMNCWILDNPKHPHFSIQDLDIEREFSVQVMQEWLASLPLRASTKRTVASALSTFFNDMIAQELLPEDMQNPLEKKAIQQARRELRLLRDRARVITVISDDSFDALVNDERIPTIRRVKNMLAGATGARDNELQALRFCDLHLDAPIPYVAIRYDLFKPGLLAPVHWEAERAAGRTEAEITHDPRAVLQDPKFDSKRDVPLHPAAVEALRWWRQVGWLRAVGHMPSDDSPIFARTKKSTDPGIFAHSGSAELMQLDLAMLDLPTTDKGRRIVFHSLRHTFSSWLKRAGADEGTIGSLLGHKPTTVAALHYIERSLKAGYPWILKLPIVWRMFAVQTQAAE